LKGPDIGSGFLLGPTMGRFNLLFTCRAYENSTAIFHPKSFWYDEYLPQASLLGLFLYVLKLMSVSMDLTNLDRI